MNFNCIIKENLDLFNTAVNLLLIDYHCNICVRILILNEFADHSMVKTVHHCTDSLFYCCKKASYEFQFAVHSMMKAVHHGTDSLYYCKMAAYESHFALRSMMKVIHHCTFSLFYHCKMAMMSML